MRTSCTWWSIYTKRYRCNILRLMRHLAVLGMFRAKLIISQVSMATDTADDVLHPFTICKILILSSTQLTLVLGRRILDCCIAMIERLFFIIEGLRFLICRLSASQMQSSIVSLTIACLKRWWTMIRKCIFALQLRLLNVHAFIVCTRRFSVVMLGWRKF